MLAAVFCLLTLPAMAGTVYKWRDEQGRIHFSDSEMDVPADTNKQVHEYTDQAVRHPPVSDDPTGDRPTPTGRLPAGEVSIPYVDREGLASRVIIHVKFNGRVTAPIMVDTGSPGMIISASLAQRLGLFDEDKSKLFVFVRGIGGSAFAIRTIIDKIAIDGLTESFVPAHIVANMSRQYQGLIGMDILSSYTITIDSLNQRLIAKPNPAAEALPAGRNQMWWQRTFREFRAHKEFWEMHAELLNDGRSGYARLPSSRRDELKEPIHYQMREAQKLYSQLSNFARWRAVPMHWRR